MLHDESRMAKYQTGGIGVENLWRVRTRLHLRKCHVLNGSMADLTLAKDLASTRLQGANTVPSGMHRIQPRRRTTKLS